MEDTLLNVTIKRFHKFENGSSLKAFADVVVNDVLLIKGLKIVEGRNGMFVSMPSEQSSKDKKWYETVRILKPEVRQSVFDQIISAYYTS